MPQGRGARLSLPGRRVEGIAIAVCAVASWIGFVALPRPSPAQPTSEGPWAERQTRDLTGSVLLGPDSLPLAGVEVSLHLITPDSGGVVDTTVSDGEGRFAFRVDPTANGDPGSTVYLVTARYRDVLYLGDALHMLSDAERDLDILVYEPRPIESVPLASRRTLVQASGGAFQILEVFELANDSDSTLVPAADDGSPWEVQLPSGAGRNATASIGFESGSFELRGDRMLLDLSVPPGGRTFSVRYGLNGPLVRLISSRALPEQLVFVEETSGIEVEGLAPAGSTTLEGKRFARYSGVDRSAGDLVALRMRAPASARRKAWLALATGVSLAAAALVAWRRTAPTASR